MLGAAWIAEVAVLPAIAASRNGRLVALASRDSHRAQRMLGPYPDARVHRSYEDVLADRDVECVYIPLVNSLHLEWTLRAFEAGKHVLCEKPLAMNGAEAATMAAAAREANRHLMEAFMYRFNPGVRDFIEGLRDPIHVQATFGFTQKGEEDYRMHAELGGGALLDVGCYTVSLARWILGEPVDVLARARMVGGVDKTVSALLEFESGRTASIWASFESPEEQEVTVIARERVVRRERPFNPIDDWQEQYRLMVESFADSVLRDTPVAIPPSESIANMRVLDRIREACR